MDVLSQKIIEFAANYLQDKGEYGTAQRDNPSWGRLVEDIPREMRNQAKLPDGFIVKGSIGAGNIAEIPWVAIFDEEITDTAQHGYYIVFLFKTDLTGFYISLNQGWTQYENQYDVQKGQLEIKKNAQKARSILRTTYGFDTNPLQLGARNALGKGYELGNICSRYFRITELDDDKILLNTLRDLMAAYRELKGLVGTNIFQITSSASEEDYQEQSQSADRVLLPPGPIKRTNKSKSQANATWFRDPGIAKIAIESAGYRCIIDKTHKTFTSKASGKPFVEAHHLVPMEQQDKFTNSLDVPENIMPLCPICHRKIHLARVEEKTDILRMLIDERKEGLNHRGIEVNFKQLEEMYE